MTNPEPPLSLDLQTLEGRVWRAMLGQPTRLDFRIAVGLEAFAAWAGGTLVLVTFPYPYGYARVRSVADLGTFSAFEFFEEEWFGVRGPKR